jgi:hypothetical protein
VEFPNNFQNKVRTLALLSAELITAAARIGAAEIDYPATSEEPIGN